MLIRAELLLAVFVCGPVACKPRVEVGSVVRSDAGAPAGDVDSILASLNANIRMFADEVGMDVAMLDSGMDDYSGFALADGVQSPEQTKQKIDQVKAQLDETLAKYKEGDDQKVTKIIDELTLLQQQYASMDKTQQQQTQQAVQVTTKVVQQVQTIQQPVKIDPVPPKVTPIQTQKIAPVLTCVPDPRAENPKMPYSIASDGQILDFSNVANSFMSLSWCEKAISQAANGLVCAHFASDFVYIAGSAIFNVATRQKIAMYGWRGHKAASYCYAAIRDASNGEVCFTVNDSKSFAVFDTQTGAVKKYGCVESEP